MVDFEVIWHRLREIAKVKNDAELARYLGLRAQSVSKAKCAHKIPDAWWATFREKEGLTREEICRDISPSPRQTADDAFDAKANEVLAEVKAWWRKKHGDDAKSALHFAMEVGRRFPELSAPDQDEENREIIKNAEDCRVEALNPEGAGE